MPTSFIAVQCFECSTMQVKQQKKSSNKWLCVVCNQKQSVRKVFAQSFMAKDVRLFVQNFNMSRQLSDQKQSISNAEPEIAHSPKSEEQKRKRNDWTDTSMKKAGRNPLQNLRGIPLKVFDEMWEDGIEPLIVTELPKAIFVKPKVRVRERERDYSCREDKKLSRPSFSNRRSQDSGRDSKTDYCTREANHKNSKWGSFMSQIRETRDLDLAREKKPVQQKIGAGKNTVSKWSSFITDEEDDQNSEIWEKREGYPSMNEEEKVEEDIHPDFL